jgi:hypothetical protein
MSTPSRAIKESKITMDFEMSGRRDSNPRPSAWKADALPTELLPLKFSPLYFSRGILYIKNTTTISSERLTHSSNPTIQTTPSVGREGFEPSKVKTNRFTVCPRWPLEYLPKIAKLATIMSRWRDSNPRPADYKSAALAS